MSKRLTHGVLAAALAVVLLSGTGATTASWSDAAELPGVTITSGRLSLAQTAMDVHLVQANGSVRELTADTRIIPGDVVRLTSTVTVTAQGDALRARLALDRSQLGLTYDGVEFPVSEPAVTTELTSAGVDAWTVMPADNGKTATATVDITVPRTTNGEQPAADRSNWWGQRLQNVTLNPGAIRWTLTQETP